MMYSCALFETRLAGAAAAVDGADAVTTAVGLSSALSAASLNTAATDSDSADREDEDELLRRDAASPIAPPSPITPSPPSSQATQAQATQAASPTPAGLAFLGSLADAQTRKIDALLARLEPLGPETTLLDIGEWSIALIPCVVLLLSPLFLFLPLLSHGCRVAI
jgi:hypothetical protein